MKIKLALLFTVIIYGFAFAQDDLLQSLDSIQTKEKEITPFAFKSMQICTMQSTKTASKGEWYFLVSHRFGDVTNGFDNFFGLDNAYTKLGGLYGVSNWLTLGIARHTYNKTFELSAKYKFISQEVDGFPFTIVGFNSVDINTYLTKDLYPGLRATNRLAFTTQLPISRKFSNSFSLELNPIWVHKNLYDNTTEKRDQLLLASGLRYKCAKRISLNLEYASRISQPKSNLYQNPLTVGMDIETGGHVFQLIFSNSQAMNDVAYYTNATGNWNSKGIFFGFNMYRVF